MRRCPPCSWVRRGVSGACPGGGGGSPFRTTSGHLTSETLSCTSTANGRHPQGYPTPSRRWGGLGRGRGPPDLRGGPPARAPSQGLAPLHSPRLRYTWGGRGDVVLCTWDAHFPVPLGPLLGGEGALQSPSGGAGGGGEDLFPPPPPPSARSTCPALGTAQGQTPTAWVPSGSGAGHARRALGRSGGQGTRPPPPPGPEFGVTAYPQPLTLFGDRTEGGEGGVGGGGAFRTG